MDYRVGFDYTYPFSIRPWMLRTRWKGCAGDDDDLKTTAHTAKNTKLCIFISGMRHFYKHSTKVARTVAHI